MNITGNCGLNLTYRKPSEQLFLNRWPLSFPNLTETMNTYIRFKQHKTSTTKHKTNLFLVSRYGETLKHYFYMQS